MTQTTDGISALQKQKLTHLFHIIDVNYSGSVDQNDFRNLLLSLTNARGLARGSQAHKELEQSLLGLWDQLSLMSDSDFNDRIDLEEWLTFFAHALSDEVFYKGLITPLENALVNLIDTYGDQRISHQDYRDIVLTNQPDLPEIATLFQRLDRNRDGYITTDEAKQALNEFFLSKNVESPGNWFFGEFARQ